MPIPLEGVTHLEAADDYVSVHGRSGTHLLHVTLADLATRLDPSASCGSTDRTS